MFGFTGPSESLRPRALFLVVACSAIAAGVGCSTDGGNDTAATSTPVTTAPAATSSTTTSVSDTDDDPDGADFCPSTDDVAAVVGHDVEQSTNAGGSGSLDVTYSYNGCSYAGDDNSYDITRVTVEGESDELPFDLLDQIAQADLATSGFTEIDDLGDEAYLDGQSVAYRDGQLLVFLDIDDFGETDGEADTADQRDALAEDLAATDLEAEATRCATVADAVEAAFGPIIDEREGAGGISVDDVDIETTSCNYDLDEDVQVRLSFADAASWDDWVEAKRSSTFTTSYEASSIGEQATFDNGEELFVDDGEQPLRIAISTPDIGAEDALALRVALAELVLDA